MGIILEGGKMRTMQQLVFDFFRLCNLEPVEIRKGVWQVRADDALMKELDGWRAQGRLLQFTFDQRSAETYGADLICHGSYRLNSILQVIRKQGVLSQAHIPHHFFHEPGIRKKILGGFGAVERAYVVNCSLQYSQYLELEILAEARGLQKKESIHTVVVDLSSGKVLKFAFPYHLLKAGEVPKDTLRKRKCSFKQAFANATTHLHETMAASDHNWAYEARHKLTLEEEKLREFFQGRTESEEFKAKKQELHQRLAPAVRIDALRGAILLVPLFHYRLVVVETHGKEKSKNLTYDPIGNQYLQDSD
ncbi:MAG TPA: hypothetical protein DDZ66_08955 [Firmicutes bacterium]|nr:hypothetical protein [Bacillota bacterium]